MRKRLNTIGIGAFFVPILENSLGKYVFWCYTKKVGTSRQRIEVHLCIAATVTLQQKK